MIALAVLPVFAVLVAAPAGPEDGCPSARMVTEAMQARFPGFLVMPDEIAGSARSDILRATLDVAPDGTVVRFSLIDVRGDIQLRRTLPASGRSKAVADCVALADTVAAIVERYLGTIAYDSTEGTTPVIPHAPPPPPPTTPLMLPGDSLSTRPRAALALLGVAWRTTTVADQSGLEGRLGAQCEMTRASPRLAGAVSVGATLGLGKPLPDRPGNVTVQRFPLRLGALLELAAGPGWVEPAVMAGVDVLRLSSPRVDDTPSYLQVRFGPVVEAGVAYRMKIAGRFYLRPALVIGGALKTYRIGVASDSGPMAVEGVHLLTTPWAYASFGIDTAVVFR